MQHKWPFAVGITLQDARDAIHGRREFRETVKGSVAVINYDFCFGATFPDPEQAGDAKERRLLQVRRECRGLVFDAKTGVLIARRLHKFFNLDQSDECRSDKVDMSEPHVVLEKLDGSMISSARIDGQLVLLSKNGPTELSQHIEQALEKANKDWKGLSQHWIDKGFTPTFEWISPDNQIVLRYDHSDLVLVALRNNHDGSYVPYAQMREEGARFGVTVVETVTREKESLSDLVSRVKCASQLEGCVLQFQTSHLWFKIKSEWYFAQSKSHIALPNSERQLWHLILSGQVDDVLGNLSAEVRRDVEAFTQSLFEALSQSADRLVERARKLNSGEKKHTQQSWAETVKNLPDAGPITRMVMFKLMDPDDAEVVPLLVSSMVKNCNPKSFDVARKELGVEHINFY